MDTVSGMPWALLLLLIAVALSTSYLSLALMLRSGWPRRAIDRPNERSLHKAPTPRIGGLGVACALLVCAAAALTLGLQPHQAAVTAVVSYFCLALLSLADDIYQLPALPRLLMHLLVAGAAALALGVSPLWLPVAALFLAWSANLFNFMDGADGLAGSMAMLGFGTYAVAAGFAGHLDLMLLCAVLSAASAAFLHFNLPPARLFLGDSGSIPLGFTAGLVGLYGSFEAAWPPWFGIIVFFPFWFDASLTLLRRIQQRKPLGQAHREHLYQRAILSGLSHSQVLGRVYGLTLCSMGLAAAAYYASFAIAALIIVLQILVGLLLCQRIGRLERLH